MNTTEKNKLIAEFMGGKLDSPTSEYYYFLNEGTYKMELKYHVSWDWLMPVVDKIEGLGGQVIICRFFCSIIYIDPLNRDNNFDNKMASGVKINAIYSAVLNFIEWFNAQSK